MKSYIYGGILLLLRYIWGCKALDCQPMSNNFPYTITVDTSGHGNFTSVQSAIDYIPEGNSQWRHIILSPGIYRENITISAKKPCIFLEGESIKSTIIDWPDYTTTFVSYPENILVKSITFKNSYDLGIKNWRGEKKQLERAVAARIKGDKSAFYSCGFQSVQDTLLDEQYRHYFKDCFIEGAIDFIFGKAQSIYQGCRISVNIGRYIPGGLVGSITAQKKEWSFKASGFVFKDCTIDGTGSSLLGRAWGPYSTVIFHNTFMSDVINPQGWDAWSYVNHEANFTYVEDNNRGPGADLSKRVPWINKINAEELNKFLDISFINQDGWLQKLPYKVY